MKTLKGKKTLLRKLLYCHRCFSIVILSIGFVDFGVAIYHRYNDGMDESIGYAAHIGGAAAGFLIGMNVLRNLEHEVWT